MTSSQFLAKVFGFYFVIGGAALIFRPRMLRQVTQDYMRSPGLTYFSGQIMVVVAILLLIKHQIWTFSYVGAITLFGWIILLKGLSLLFFTDTATSELADLDRKRNFNYVSGAVVIGVGVWLVLEGYDWI
jgi:threonine/homoserine/homoserine lactone efflux protein